jgi:hypothetical protein
MKIYNNLSGKWRASSMKKSNLEMTVEVLSILVI